MTSRLHRSIHNQLRICTSPPQLSLPDDDDDDDEDDESLTSKNLSLRRFDLVSTLPDILMQSRPYAVNIKLLDISYSMADTNTLNSLCQHLLHLQTLHARSCGLQGTLNAVSWPEELRSLDLSRNELCECPQGLQKLMYLSSLNISGNSIKFVPPLLLKIPCLRRCLLVNNPIGNVPKNVCREGVERMRVFLEVEPLPMPKDMPLKGSIRTSTRFRRHSSGSSLESCKNLRRYILSQQGSFESGYESNQRHHSSSSASSDCVSTDIEFSESSDIESDSIASNQQWKRFDSGTELPKGYVNASVNQFCRVYLPEDCKGGIEIHDVKDMSFHPMLKDNELLVTSVIRVTPHGRTFESKPAIIVLPHCTKKGFSQMNLIPMCSNTGEFETTDWMAIDPFPEVCEIFENHIMFTTSHFSFFAVVASFPYPSSSIRVGPNIGGDLLIPELPLFSLHIPDNSLAQSITIKGTVYYCDSAYRPPNDYALASACVGLEPHGTEFNNPVIVRVPIPDYRRIRAHYPDAKLELWCSLKSIGDADIPCDWNRTKDVNIQLDSSCQIATFEITHFSRYEFIWNIGSTLLQKLGLGAATIYNTLSSRSRFISVRLQAFMSQPYLRSLTFGLVVTVFKFGDPLLPPSNYPLLVADSGTKRIHLRVGDLHVKIEGCFSASLDVGEELERKGRIVDFTGEDFCERFEFALNLKSDVPFPLQEGQVLGKLRFIQWENSNPLQKSYNLMMVCRYSGHIGTSHFIHRINVVIVNHFSEVILGSTGNSMLPQPSCPIVQRVEVIFAWV